tara:strand:+ start:1714 stop:4134 length:2421 start_codon:yes stop_codon:yes gene_type:complete
MFQSKIKVYFIILLFTLIFFNGIFLGQHFFIDEDVFIMMKYSSDPVFNNGWNEDTLFGISTLYGDPGVNHHYSIFSLLERLFNKLNFYNPEIFYTISVIIIYSIAVTAIFYFLKYFVPKSNNVVALILSFLFLFGSSRYDLQFQRHWLIIGFAFPTYIMCLNEYFLTNKKIYLFKITLIFFITLHFGSIPALQNILMSGVLYLLVKFFIDKKLYLKQFLKINFFSLSVLILLGSWIWYPFINEMIQTKYIRAESYNDFRIINDDFFRIFLWESFFWLFGPLTPSNLILPTGSIKLGSGAFTNINFIFIFILILFIYQLKNKKSQEIYLFFIFYLIYLLIISLFPIVQGSLLHIIKTFSLEKVNQEVLILQICIIHMVLNSEIKENLNLILKKFFIKFYLLILSIYMTSLFLINFAKVFGFSFKDFVNSILIFFQPNFQNLPNEIVRSVLLEIYKRYEISLNFNSLAYFSLSLLSIYVIINFKKNILFQKKIFLSLVILSTNYFLATHFYPLSSMERFWQISKKNEYLSYDRFFNARIDTKNDFLNGQYHLLDKWIKSKPIRKDYFGYRETPGMNFSGLTSFYPKEEAKILNDSLNDSNLKYWQNSKLRSLVIGDISFVDTVLFKNSSINYIVIDKKIKNPISNISFVEKYRSKFIYRYESFLPFFYLANNLKYDDYRLFKKINSGTVFLKNKKYSFDESKFKDNKNKINLLGLSNNVYTFSFNSKKSDILFINNSYHKNWFLSSKEHSINSFECNFYKNCFLLKPGKYEFKISFKKGFNYGVYLSFFSIIIFMFFFLKIGTNTHRN